MLKQFEETRVEGNCQRCQMGHMRTRVVTVTRWVEYDLMIVPGVKVAVCDICGAVVENESVEQWLSAFFDGKESRKRRKKRLVEGLLILPVSHGDPN